MLEFKGVMKSEGLDSPLRHYNSFIINNLRNFHYTIKFLFYLNLYPLTPKKTFI